MAKQYVNENQENMALAIRAYNHGLRQNMINVIERLGNKATVTNVYCGLRIEQSVASLHLKILKHSGLVSFSRSGKYCIYKIEHERIAWLKTLTGLIEANEQTKAKVCLLATAA